MKINVLLASTLFLALGGTLLTAAPPSKPIGWHTAVTNHPATAKPAQPARTSSDQAAKTPQKDESSQKDREQKAHYKHDEKGRRIYQEHSS